MSPQTNPTTTSTSTSPASSHPFRSARLLYRAIEPTDQPFLQTLMQDPSTLANSTYGLFKPPSNKKAEELLKFFEERMLLAVLVCLPSPAAAIPPPPTTPTLTPEAAAAAAVAAAPTPIGYIVLEAGPPHATHYRKSEIGLTIVPPYQGRGYGSEAIQWILEWGFETAGLHRIAIGCFGYNEGAAKLYERLGFVPEGRAREAMWYRGRWWDMVGFAMLEGEWRAAREGEQREGKGEV